MRKQIFVSARLVNPFVQEAFTASRELIGDAFAVQHENALGAVAALSILGSAQAFFGIPNRAELEAAPKLEVIAIPGSGTDMFDVATATERGIAVVNAAGAQDEAVAEHALGLMLALVKRIAVSDRWFHEEKRFPERSRYIGDGWPRGFPSELDGKTIGIVGYGFAGQALARKCRLGFGMRVLAFDPYRDAVEASRQGTKLVPELRPMLAASDFVSLHVPLSDETRHLISQAELRSMKPTAYLINLSRGGTVDEKVLVQALRQGWIAGAGLDVFETEPPPDGHPLFDLENVVLTGHIGGWTRESLPRLARVALEGMIAVLRGERPERLVNPEVWSRVVGRRQ
jgi:phosphoglycerate dehydrogenase-like enzyme